MSSITFKFSAHIGERYKILYLPLLWSPDNKFIVVTHWFIESFVSVENCKHVQKQGNVAKCKGGSLEIILINITRDNVGHKIERTIVALYSWVNI